MSETPEHAVSPPPGEITVLLNQWREGDPNAFERLMPVAYSSLHSIAERFFRQERPDHTLQATALVSELYLRLCQQRQADWENRTHFFAFAARLMRAILIDHARSSSAKKRGSGAAHVPLTDELPWLGSEPEAILDLDRSLASLADLDPDKIRLVELRYFLGLTAAEVAEVIGLSKATVDRELRFVRAWLYDRLGRGPAAESSS